MCALFVNKYCLNHSRTGVFFVTVIGQIDLSKFKMAKSITEVVHMSVYLWSII